MFTFDLAHKLRQVSPRLYLGDRGHSFGEWEGIGLYARRKTRGSPLPTTLLSSADSDTLKKLSAEDAGQTDDFVCGVSVGWVPEYPVFDRNRKLVARGWRSIALELVRAKIATLDRVRRVFCCGSLGESDFDQLSFDEKRDRISSLPSVEGRLRARMGGLCG